MIDKDIIEIRFHGRGGQGAVTAANILAYTAYKAGLWGQAFPFFGAERRGAPVKAFARISKRRVRMRSMIREPDYLVILDPSLPKLVDVFSGLKPDGAVIINSPEKPDFSSMYRTYYVNASKIAIDRGLVIAGWPLVNTAILGALVKLLKIPIDTLEEAIIDYVGERMGPKNAEAARQAYEEVVCVE